MRIHPRAYASQWTSAQADNSSSEFFQRLQAFPRKAGLAGR